MLAFSRMKSVLAPCFSKATAFSFAVGSHSPPPISLFSKSIRLMNSSSFLHNPSIVCTLSTIALKNHSSSRQVSTLKPGASSSPSSSASGEIHVIVGPMFAGKTTTLLKRIKSESSNGRSIALIKSDKDTRYALDSVVTHDGEKLSCWSLADLCSFKEKVGAEAYKKLEVIGIDEAQFFKDLYDFCSKAADIDGKTLIVAGLDGDYLRRSFGSVLDIIPIADSITKLSARCELCGKRAFFTLRKTEETETELIAGGDVYMPVCRKHYVSGQAVKHYVSGQVVKEATKTVIEDSQRVVEFGAMLL